MLFLALATHAGIGLYKRLIGCPRAFTDCYLPGTELLFWPQTLSALAFYLALMMVLLILGKRTLCWLLRLLRTRIR